MPEKKCRTTRAALLLRLDKLLKERGCKSPVKDRQFLEDVFLEGALAGAELFVEDISFAITEE